MKVFGFFYNDCIFEGAAGLQSIHFTVEGANKAKDAFVENYIQDIKDGNKLCLENGLEECVRDEKFDDYQDVFVKELEIVD